MSFLQQPLLWGLLAAAIPIIIHLLNRRRHRTVKWAAMEFLLKATRESRGKKKLKYLIILACRALAIAALIFAISRPLVGGFLGWSGGKANTVILILDRSASMEQLSPNSNTSKRASAIASVRKSLEELGSPRLILIDSASGKAQDIASPDALEELSATSPTDTKASISSLFSTAIDYLLEHSLGKTEIWVASDLQLSDWAPEDGRWDAIRTGLNDLPQQPTLRVLSLASAPKDNYSIRTLSSRRNEDMLVLDLELTRSNGEGPAAIPVTFTINGTSSSDKVTLKGQTYQFQKRFPLGKNQGSGHGFASIPSDTNARDNVSFFAYGEDLPTTTFLVTEGGESPDWLTLASSPPGYEDSQTQRISASSAHQVNWGTATLVIWQAPLPEGTIAEEFTRYLESGGAAIILPPNTESTTNFLGLSWGERSISPEGQYFIVKNWNHTDGPLRDGIEGTQIPVTKLKSIIRREIVGEATSLASWNDDTPFLVRTVIGDGSAIFVASLPDYTWSNLADADVLLPIVQRMIAKGDTRFGSALSAITGTQRALPADGEIRNRLDTYAESTSSNADYEAGVWKLGERTLATNRPKSEDQWQILTNNNLDTVFNGVNYTFFEDTGESESLAREIWRVFLMAMLVFLITEAILCLQPKPKST